MKTINRTIEEIDIAFVAYSYKGKGLFNSDAHGFEVTTDELITEIEKENDCKVLEITSQITRKYKLAIDIHKAIEIGTLEEIE